MHKICKLDVTGVKLKRAQKQISRCILDELEEFEVTDKSMGKSTKQSHFFQCQILCESFVKNLWREKSPARMLLVRKGK